jgi:AcrR family transcriptional regulator
MTGGSKMKSNERREQILQESLKLFVQFGMDQVTTRKIAQAVGISQPSLYAHFNSRDEIAIELSRRAFERLRERMLVAQSAYATPSEKLRGMCMEYVRFGLEESDAYRMAFMIERTHFAPEHEAAIHQTGMRGFSIVHDFFRQARRADDIQTATLAQSAWATMHGLVSLLLARPNFPWVDRSALIDAHLDRMCATAII